MAPVSGPVTEKARGIRHVDGIRHIADDFDVFLLDMWGVMHDGSKPYEGVLDTIKRLKELDKTMVILSNSSKRRDNSVRMLKKLGFDPSDFDQIITSGELAYRMLSGDDTLECESWPVLERINKQPSRKVFCLGSGSEDVEYCESCGWTMAPVEDADLVMARGTFTIVSGSDRAIEKEDNEDEYFRVLDESLKIAAQRMLPLFVTNPDKVRPDEGLPPMPGAIGDAYEAILGDKHSQNLVKRVGKPFRDVYDIALSGRKVDLSRVCMIGDALETDVTGASTIGCTAVWIVNDGIHGADIADQGNGVLKMGTAAVLKDFNEKEGTYANDSVLMPSLCVPHFRW